MSRIKNLHTLALDQIGHRVKKFAFGHLTFEQNRYFDASKKENFTAAAAPVSKLIQIPGLQYIEEKYSFSY